MEHGSYTPTVVVAPPRTPRISPSSVPPPTTGTAPPRSAPQTALTRSGTTEPSSIMSRAHCAQEVPSCPPRSPHTSVPRSTWGTDYRMNCTTVTGCFSSPMSESACGASLTATLIRQRLVPQPKGPLQSRQTGLYTRPGQNLPPAPSFPWTLLLAALRTRPRGQPPCLSLKGRHKRMKSGASLRADFITFLCRQVSPRQWRDCDAQAAPGRCRRRNGRRARP